MIFSPREALFSGQDTILNRVEWLVEYQESEIEIIKENPLKYIQD